MPPSRARRLASTALVVAAAVIGLAVPAGAAPWWFVHFTQGNDALDNNSEIEFWLGFAVDSALVSDTVYMSSFTWATGSQWEMINGIGGANDVGANAVAAAKSGADPQVYIFDDSDAATDTGPPMRTTDADYTYVPENPTTNTHHNKLVVIPNRFVITGSANWTTGGVSAQPNNIFLIKPNVPSVIARYVSQMEEFRGGTYHDNNTTGSGSPYFWTSPNGDTIEVYFSPDDHGNLTTGAGPGNAEVGSGADVEGVVIRVINEASESIFYGINQTNMDQSNFLPNPINEIINAPAGVLVEGWLDTDNSTGGVTRGDLQNDHTSRDGNTGYTGELHHKIFIVDQEKVILGSPNLTSTALSNPSGNDENLVVVHDFRLARKYLYEYRRVMSRLSAEAVGQADSFDSVPSVGAAGAPAAPTGFSVSATDTAFYASWTATGTGDVTRYFLFVDTAPIDTNAIGNGRDDDADGMVDEDPRGDADGFRSGTTDATKTWADDDADDAVDEDRWMYPEVQVKGRASTSGAIRTWNVGDALLGGTNYYFAVVSVDTHGNESAIDTFGPLALSAGAADTSLIVQKNSDTGPANVRQGETNVVVATLFLRGDTGAAGDTLSLFTLFNLGLSDSQDVAVRLWRDENADSRIGAADSLVATLSMIGTTDTWRSTITNDSRARLGSTGKTFLVAIDVANTATIGETFQARVPAASCSAVRSDTGPDAAVTNNGVFTIVSANPVDVLVRGDYASATIDKGATDSPAISLRLTVAVANDTLQVFRVRNLGTMTSADVSALRLYHDGNGDSVLNASPTDTLIATLPFRSGADWGADTIAYRFGGTSIDLIVALSTSAGATGGRTFQGRIVANTVDCVNADTGPSADRTTSTVLTVRSDTSPDTSIVLNEFIPDPNNLDHDNNGTRGDTDEEFIEIYNNSDGSVDIGNWKIDDDLTPGDIVLPSGLVLGPRQFLVVYNDTVATGPRWWRYDSAGVVRLETGTFTGTGLALNNSSDTVILANASDVQVDSRLYTTFTADSSHARLWDGAETWTTAARPSPGKNDDPTSNLNNPSPNAVFSLSAVPSTVTEGDSFTIAVTARNRDNGTIVEFNRTAALSVNTGTVAPSVTGTFSSGSRSESISITNVAASGSVTVFARYNSTTSGTVAVQVDNAVTCTFVVDLEARTNETGCTAVLTGPVSRTGLSETSGRIVFANIPAGTYAFEGKEFHHLQVALTGLSITADTTIAVPLMRAGDANNDNWVSIFDAARVKWGATGGFNSNADIDGDNDVDAVDLDWCRTNFGRRGDP